MKWLLTDDSEHGFFSLLLELPERLYKLCLVPGLEDTSIFPLVQHGLLGLPLLCNCKTLLDEAVCGLYTGRLYRVILRRR